MPKRSTVLKTILSDKNNFHNSPEQLEALNALLKAEDEAQFKTALKAHRELWDPLLRSNGATSLPLDDGDFKLNGELIALTTLATQQRSILALAHADEAQLEDLIKQATANPAGEKALRLKFFDDTGKSLFGPEVTIPNWNSDNDTFLRSDYLPKLQAEAQRQLLIKKITVCNDKDALNSLLASKNQESFKEAVKTLFGIPLLPAPRPKHPLEKIMLIDSVNKSLIRIAAKKGLSLALEGLSPDEVVALGNDNLNKMDAGAFKLAFRGYFPEAAKLHNEDINAIKGLLGAKYLPLIAPTNIGNLAEMEGIAKSNDPEIIKGHLRTIFHPDNGFVDHSVNATSIPVIRKAYATQALLQKIELCNDGPTLEALTQITDADSLTEVLKTKAALGYAGEPAFREVLATIAANDLKPLIVVAHIRKNIAASASQQILKGLIEVNTHPQFAALYHDTFSSALNPDTKTKITAHLTKPENIKKTREQALLAYAKTALSELTLDDIENLDDYLLALVNADDANIVNNLVDHLLGYEDRAPNPIVDLVGGDVDPDTGISKEIRKHAAIVKVVNDAKKPQDLSDVEKYDTLIENINNFTNGDPQDEGITAFLLEPEFPTQEKQRIQGHFLESLIRNYPTSMIADPVPPEPDKLTKLAKETDLEKFKELLVNQYELINLSWVNAKTMEAVQKSACVRVIELGQTNPLQFGGQTHPKLMELIASFPLGTQRALLDNPRVLTALAAARDSAEIKRVLGNRETISPTQEALITATTKENNKLSLVAEIANSEIAKILAELAPSIKLTINKISNINALLLEEETEFSNDVSYKTIIQSIGHMLDPQPNKKALYAAFGLDDAGEIANDAKQVLIDQQHLNNANLIADYEGATPDVQQVILALLPLSKNGAFPGARLLKEAGHEGIVTDINASKTLDAFCKLINEPPPGRDYKNIFVPPLDQQLTPQAYARIKRDIRAKLIADPDYSKQTLEQQRLEISEVLQKFRVIQLDSEQEKKLQDLSTMNLIGWFNPAFQASSKANAAKHGPQFIELAKQCDAYVINLKNQLRVIQEQISSLPTESGLGLTVEIKQKVDARYNSLQRFANQLNDEIGKYEDVQKLFHGNTDGINSLAKKGLLKTLELAKEGKFDSKINRFNITSVDYDASKRAELTAANRVPTRGGTEVLSAGELEAGGSGDSFTTVNAVPAGKIREHTVVYMNPVTGAVQANGTGCYLEERSAKNLAGEVDSGVVNYEASLKLTATHFPKDEQGQVFFAMAMASQLVANLKEPPTGKNPIIIRGANPVLVKYLWTALMIIGEADNRFKFGRDQIKVISGQFDPESEYSLGGLRWSGDTKEKFTNHTAIVPMLKGIKEITDCRLADAKKQEQHVKDTSEMTRFFRNNMPKVEQQNKEQEENTRPTLGTFGSGG